MIDVMILGRCSFFSAIRCLSETSKFCNTSYKGFILPETLSQVNKLPSGRFGHTILKINIKMASTSQGGTDKPFKSNKLALEKSPYLLQHAHNPVDWYPWGEEALEKAKREDKLIFLSVGYSTCHWCHVMEKESFENPEIAKIMNRYFVNIKVDREERPDIDKIYMTFIQSISGHGGWPMSVFLTPNLTPIMGGTYFPPIDRYGQPGFEKILLSIAHKWLENKQDLIKSGSKILEVLKMATENNNQLEKIPPSEDCGKKCVQQLIRSYDREFGGFSDAPKFPQPVNLNILFHMYARDPKSELSQECLSMCLHTLKKMADGGIHDHIGQGFSRYSVDGKWHVPHFEKMLYDQGQLLRSYSSAFVVTKDPFFANIVDDIVSYVTRDLRHKEGGYYSAEDADSFPTTDAAAKKEGAFYVWTAQEIDELLGKSVPGRDDLTLSDIFSYHFNVKTDGNIAKRQDPHGELTGQNVLIIYGSLRDTADKFNCTIEETEKYLAEAKKVLFEARSRRPRPHLDDKIVAAWNGLMISGLSHAGIATKNKQYIQYAKDAANFIKKYLFDKENQILLRSCYRGEGDQITQPSVPIPGFHSDYAFVIQGILDLYEASLDSHWLEFAEQLQDIQNKLFWDDKDGAYFVTTNNDKNIILRLKDEHDGAEPSGNSVACSNLLRLAACMDRIDYNEKVVELLSFFNETLTRIPIAVPELVCALLHYWDATTQIFIAGKKDAKDTEELLDIIRDRLIPAKLVLLTDPEDRDSLLFQRNEVISKMKTQNGRATAYVCRHRTCSLPVVEPRQLAELIDEQT
ncbi:spermatogenesis-associated protein 20 isoform X2 [Chelonus insularis]|uniref:spermatogenesis-associated protein 20 isoform X2 n=1 Tax=Chelonus insularis TaxID=460826 RepID=UPI00158900AE|nr:spermatogenesis-associated protein 20 isoform X2 [Chelonus insularis]